MNDARTFWRKIGRMFEKNDCVSWETFESMTTATTKKTKASQENSMNKWLEKRNEKTLHVCVISIFINKSI